MNRKIEFIPIKSIEMDHHPLNPSTLALIKFIESGGSIPPIHICKKPFGGFKICDGRHRVTAFKLLGISEIKAKFSNTPLKRIDYIQ